MERVTLECCVQIACDHCIKCCTNCIEGEDDDVSIRSASSSSSLDCVNCSECHVVVLTYDYVDIRIAVEEGFHDFLSLGLSELTGLHSEHVPVVMLCEDVSESLGSSNLCGCSDRALECYDVDVLISPALLLKVILKPMSGCLAFLYEVAAYPSYIELIGHVHHTVGKDNRDSCVICFLQNRFPSGLYNRSYYDVVDFPLDEVSDGPDLVFLLLLGIIENLVKVYMLPGAYEAVTYMILIIVLLVRPTGLFGKAVSEKV